jgi:alanine racemase
VFTHFASADVPESPLLDTQRERFERATAVVDDLAKRRVRRHACNSAALLRDSRVWYDAVRPGLLLYGIVPPPLAATIPLQPVMSLTSRVTAVKGLRPGEGSATAGAFRRRRRDRSRWYRPGTPTASTRAWAGAARCSFAAIACRWSAPCRWT